MKILIIDDSRVARNNIKKALSGLVDIQFLEADNGITGLLAVEKENPDLIFTDWYMDEMDGLELIKKIRENNNPVKICMLTSEANNERQTLARSTGADYILQKPTKNEDIAKALEHLLG